MFDPRYRITGKVAKALMGIEADRQVVATLLLTAGVRAAGGEGCPRLDERPDAVGERIGRRRGVAGAGRGRPYPLSSSPRSTRTSTATGGRRGC